MIQPPPESIKPPMRVGLVVGRFPVGSQLFIYELALALQRAECDVDILPLDGADADGAGNMGSLASAHNLVRMPPPLNRLNAVLHALRRPQDVRVDLRKPRRWAATSRQSRLFGAQAPYDIIHVQFAMLGLDVMRQQRINSLRTRALIVHMRGYDISGHVRASGSRVYDALFGHADMFIANCAYFRDVAIDLGCPPERCVVIGSPVDTAFFKPPPSPRPAPEGRPLRLIAVGRLVEKKGFSDAIAAMWHLAQAGVDATLDILGDGPERTALTAQIDRLGLHGWVYLRGAADRVEVLTALYAADIGLAPSVTAQTGDQDAPVNTLKEQMATGLPVVATYHGGIPELVIDGENGRLVPEHNPQAIADAILDLLSNSKDWPALGAAGRARVVKQYAREVVLQQTLHAYDKALENSVTRNCESHQSGTHR